MEVVVVGGGGRIKPGHAQMVLSESRRTASPITRLANRTQGIFGWRDQEAGFFFFFSLPFLPSEGRSGERGSGQAERVVWSHFLQTARPSIHPSSRQAGRHHQALREGTSVEVWGGLVGTAPGE